MRTELKAVTPFGRKLSDETGTGPEKTPQRIIRPAQASPNAEVGGIAMTRTWANPCIEERQYWKIMRAAEEASP